MCLCSAAPPDKEGRCGDYQLLACCFGTLCVILLLVVIGTLNVSESRNTNLTGENLQLKTINKNLADQVKTMKAAWNEFSGTLAQKSVDAYCPKVGSVRTCQACPKDWLLNLGNCYAYNDAKYSDQRTWAGAREDCSGKISDLTAVNYVFTISVPQTGITGFWIGLRAVNGIWKWINGTNLINQPAADGQCVTSLSGSGWRSVSCSTPNAWICEKKAVSV
uniref:C-type lectin domain-containing protein n=1 Tax=Nothobranchius furzeri TaxID=105023 RepID=A0A8C6LM56_NOTFU